MNDKIFNNVIFRTLSATIAFAAIAKGAVNLWSVTIVEWTVFILLFLWLWRVNNRAKGERPFAPSSGLIDWPIWIFVGLALMSWFYSVYPYDSTIELFRILTYVAVYYLVANHFSWPIQVRFFMVLVAVGAALSVLGIGQYFFDLNHSWWNSPRLLSATYVNHAHFAGLLEMTIPLSIGLLVGVNRDEVTGPFQLLKGRILLGVALGLMLTAFILTQSRGAWIVLAAASVILCIVLVKQKSLPKWGMAALLMGLALFIAFIGFAEDRVASRMHTISVGGESSFFKGRLPVYQHSLKIIKDDPWTGTGVGTFAWAFPKYRPEGFGVRFYYTHNDYIQTIVEMGILVIPVLLWGIFVVLKKGFSRKGDDFRFKRAMRLACGVGILSLMLHGSVDFNFHIPANMLVFVSLVAIVTREGKSKKEKVEL